MGKIHDQAYQHHILSQTIDSLLYNQFINSVSSDVSKQIDSKELKKAGWLASILANSDSDEHKKKAQLFASLLFLQHSQNIEAVQLSYVILARSGNLIATKFLSNLFSENGSTAYADKSFTHSFGTLLDIEVGVDRLDKTIEIGSERFLLSEFQKALWESLITENRISISAPTSAGKSFIIQRFIQQKFLSEASLDVLYIVPSKALLNQVSQDFTQLLGDDVKINTAFIEEQLLRRLNDEQIWLDAGFDYEDFGSIGINNKQLYILTPERCLGLLQLMYKRNYRPDIIFVDEIQNVEDEGGRGALMEHVLEELAELCHEAKIFSAGPFIKDSNILFSSLFGTSSKEVKTLLSPVFQIRAIIRPIVNENALRAILKSSYDSDNVEEISITTDFDLNKEGNLGKKIARVLSIFGTAGQNIVYSPRTDYAEKWSLTLAESLTEEEEISLTLRELIEYLEEEIHPKYYLIQCLKSNIAFHHSKLADIIRKEIEDLFASGEIKYLYCTSTLLQGVNLPANNLFITSPNKRNIRLSSFEFGNLIGRAGRIRDSLYGSIYCIESIDTQEGWADDFLSASYEKEVLPATQKALNNPNILIENLDKTSLDIDINDGATKYTINILRQKYMKNEGEVSGYLATRNVNQKDIDAMLNLLSTTLDSVSLISGVLKLNPTIDPLLQEKLYQAINSEGIAKWVVIPNRNFYERIKKDLLDNYKYEELSFYWQLVTIFEKLDAIFKIKDEAFFKHGVSLSIAQMVIYAITWLNSLSYGQIIKGDIRFYAHHSNENKRIDINSETDINKRINEIITIHTHIVTYLLVKYLKLLNDILKTMMTEEEQELYKFSLSLPTMLELGTTESAVITLISNGINRSVALKVFEEFKKIPNYEEQDILDWLKGLNSIKLKPIYIRYLKKLGYLSEV